MHGRLDSDSVTAWGKFSNVVRFISGIEVVDDAAAGADGLFRYRARLGVAVVVRISA